MIHSNPPAASFEQFSADRLNRDREKITLDWIVRLSSQLGIRPRRVLPSEELLDGIPPVLSRAAEFLLAGDDEKITAQQLMTEELKEIARLRRRQGYDVQEIVREFDELAEILDEAALHWLDEYGGEPDAKSVGRVFGRVNRAPLLMGEVTVGIYREEEIESRHNTARELRDFAEILMHQIKTPLAAAEGAALLLQNDEISSISGERRRFAEIIQRNLKRARTVIDDVRDLAFAQLAQDRRGRTLPLARVLEEVLTEIDPLAKEKGVAIEVREPVPEVKVDATRVTIILLNLVGNAAKYADMTKPTRWVNVDFEPANGSRAWWVVVSDNGLGIPPEVHARIFERFFRAHPEAAEGTGLGLPIVKEAIRQLESEIEFESAPGRGTTFRFLLTVPPDEPADA
jgi:signal transduction histidine kinase